MRAPEEMSREELEDEVILLRERLSENSERLFRSVCVDRWRLTGRETDVLAALYHARGRMMSKSALLDAIYIYSDPPLTRALHVHICHLRRKMKNGWLETVCGQGYRLTKVAVSEITAMLEPLERAA